MKKDKDREDKERKKKDKKQKVKDKATLTLDELRRLDEARRSLIGKSRKKKEEKLPSGITADYMDQFRSGLDMGSDRPDRALDFSSVTNFQQLREHYENLASASGLHSDSSNESMSYRSGNSYPPRPPKRGILKGKNESEYLGIRGNIDDDECLMENTMQNELIMYENIGSRHLEALRLNSFSSLKASNGSTPDSPQSLSPQVTQMSPSAQYSSSSVLTSPEPTTPRGESDIGEALGWHIAKVFNIELKLPSIIPPQPPSPRTLTIMRSPAGDFGFSLRRAQIAERGPSGIEGRRTIVFAEPGAVGKGNLTGLIPGDRLLQVNGIPVENRSRDEIIELIKASPDSVKLVVSVEGITTFFI